MAVNPAQSAAPPIQTATALLAVAFVSACAALAVWFGHPWLAILAIAVSGVLAAAFINRQHGGRARAAAIELERQSMMLRQAHRIAQLCYWQWRPHTGRRHEESDGDYVYTDDTEELFGHDAETMAAAGGDYWELIAHPDDRESARARFLQFLRDDTPVHVQEYRINHPKRGERYIRECAEKTLDAAGRLIGIAGTLQDVTDAHRTQQALREGEAKLRRGFRMAKLGHWSFEPNRPRPEGGTGVYTYSDQVWEIYGISGDELDASGENFYETYIHPDDRAQLKAQNESFLRDDRASYTHEYRFLKRDGKIAYIHESAEKIRDEANRVVQIVGTIQDVTEQRLADIALRESEAKLKLGYRIAKMGHWSFDPNARPGELAKAPYTWSDEAAEIFGVPAAELNQSGGTFYDRYVHRDDRDDLKKLDAEFLGGDLPSYVQEYRVVLPDGSLRYVLESAEKRLDAAGRLVQVDGIVQDVTGLRRSALSMRRVERQMRRAYRLAKLGYWYWESTDGSSEDVNHSQLSEEICEIFGADREELHWDDGKAFCEHFVHPDDREMVLHVFAEFDQGLIDNYTMSYRVTHPSGEIRHVRSVSERIRDEHGRPLYGIGIIQDLTEVKTAEATLRRSEYQLRRAQRVARLYCWHTEEDPQGPRRIVFDHEFYTEILQRVPEPPISGLVDFIERFVHPDDRLRTLPIGTAFAREEIDSYSLEYRMLRPDGSVIYIRSAGERMRDTDGNTLQLFGALQDVTDLKQHEQELIETKNEAELANRSKSEFLTNMSHELRTPLNAIIGFSQVIRDQLFGSDQARYVDYARDIHKSGQHLLDIINDILDVSKLEAGKHVLYEQEMALGEIVEVCLNISKARAAEGAVKLSAYGFDSLPLVWAEERGMKQVLLNLLSNAVKFTPRNGSVSVAGRVTQSGEVEIAVTDTGRGIPPDVLPHLFRPFRQGDNSISRDFGGSGLGLAISRRLIELHGGRIEVESELGRGTTVTITLPVDRVIPDLDALPKREADAEAKIAI
ncbi:PAS domain-containing protein [Dongia sedimenti]|uniref:histidine kinase n=1 Tax=Dongia sedimenti TaxID=3064282 RepID=A0ABU0YPG5_9PROT|nr:PAS domain-containing protein [Rhodospirillaceae bacterium R-7]